MPFLSGIQQIRDTIRFFYLINFAEKNPVSHLRIRYGVWYEPPRTNIEAAKKGYTRKNYVCQTHKFHGFMYTRPNDNKARLIFDSNGNIAGIQSVIPGNMKGFNRFNESINLPPRAVKPPLLPGEVNENGVQMYTITAYFKHPRLLCSPPLYDIIPERGLYLQTGFEVETDYIRIPMESQFLTPDWKKGSCVPAMGQHYYKDLTPELACEKLHPLFLMYNPEGELGAFGWTFQGNPPYESPPDNVNADDYFSWFQLTPDYYPFLFDVAMLPPCMKNPEFHVFGLHIWLRHHRSMVCDLGYIDKVENRKTKTTTKKEAVASKDTEHEKSNSEYKKQQITQAPVKTQEKNTQKSKKIIIADNSRNLNNKSSHVISSLSIVILALAWLLLSS